MRLSTTTVGELFAEVDGTVEGQATVLVEINVQSLEVSWSVDDTNLSSLHEVIGDNHMLLVGGDLDVVRADGGLILIGVIETLDIVQVADVQGSNVVGSSESQIDEAAILGDVGAVGRWGVSSRYFKA